MPPRPAVDIPFPLGSFPGASSSESAGRLINCYSEPLGDPQNYTGPAKQVWRRSPGLTQFAVTGFTGYRGAILVNNLLFVAVLNRVITSDTNGTIVNVGALPGTKRVTWARNLTSPTPDIQCVDPANGAFAVTTASVTSFTGGGVLPAPLCVCAGDAYFFWGIGDNRIFAAGPNSTVVNALTFTTANSRSTGNLLRVVTYKGLLFVFCSTFTEIYTDTANPFPAFPYTRMAVLDRGLLGANAISGWEDGFGKLYWVADDFGVYRLTEGSISPEKVSSPDVDRAIKAVSDKTTLEASCYVHAGHSIWALSSPTWTWEFNLNTQRWNERWSYQPGNNTTGAFGRWRSTGGTLAFGKWITGDTQSGNLDYVDDTNQQEIGNPLLMRLESGPVDNYPNRIRVGRVDMDFVTGVGIASGSAPTQTDPQCEISWSDDEGTTWANPLIRPLGRQAAGKVRVWATGLGQSGPSGRRWRVDISDPVYAGFTGGKQSANPRAD